MFGLLEVFGAFKAVVPNPPNSPVKDIGLVIFIFTPVKPACLASDKQVSRDVSPPSSGISSLLQAIGAIPNFTDILFIFVRIMLDISNKNNKKFLK